MVAFLQRWAYLTSLSSNIWQAYLQMVQQGEAHRWKAHQVSDKKARGHNIVQPNISAEFNLQWGEGTPNRWYERSEKVPTGFRALIAVLSETLFKRFWILCSTSRDSRQAGRARRRTGRALSRTTCGWTSFSTSPPTTSSSSSTTGTTLIDVFGV